MTLFTSKLPNTKPSIFTVMSVLAQKHGAVNLSQGFPDFPCSSELIDLVTFYMKNGDNQYAPMSGVPELRKQISQKFEKLYGITVDAKNEITVTSGATEGLYSAISAFIRPNDEVIIFEPAYDSYRPAVELNGGKIIPVKLTFPDFRIDWETTAQAISERTKMLILNFPHNPSGSVLEQEDLEELAQLTKNTDILILSDEVYEHLVFDHHSHRPIFQHPELRKRTLAVYSFGKTFHATGWKVGYCIAPKNLSKEFRKTHEFVTFSTNTPFQKAIAEHLKKSKNYLDLPSFFQKKRDHFNQILMDSRFEFLPTKSTYFQLANYRQISDEKDTDFAVRMTQEFGVAVIPISVFYTDGTDNQLIRFCFAKESGTLQMAGEKLIQI